MEALQGMAWFPIIIIIIITTTSIIIIIIIIIIIFPCQTLHHANWVTCSNVASARLWMSWCPEPLARWAGIPTQGPLFETHAKHICFRDSTETGRRWSSLPNRWRCFDHPETGGWCCGQSRGYWLGSLDLRNTPPFQKSTFTRTFWHLFAFHDLDLELFEWPFGNSWNHLTERKHKRKHSVVITI